jgi:DNA mismatch repair protein MutS
MELAIDSHEKVNGAEKVRSKKEEQFQMSFFQLNDPVLEQIKADILKTDINTLTPVEALLKLNEIKRIVGG